MNIIRTISFLAAGMTAICAWGTPLSPQQALSRALSDSPARTRAAADAADFSLSLTRRVDSNAMVYLFHKPDGAFVVASADDTAPALLGYGSSAVADTDGDYPPAFLYWLDEQAREIAYAAANGRLLRETQRPERDPIAPLCSTTWDQGDPYNAKCPEYNGMRAYTGCSATSTAQVMKYHNWPAVGVGSHSYTWQDREFSIDFAQTPFDWANMPDQFNYFIQPDDQVDAVSTLMMAVGYSLNMMYGTSGSGAYSTDIAPALTSYFKYDKGMRFLYRDFYSLAEWEEIVYNSLRDFGPVIYNGQSNAGGHSFVCDGYDTDGYFHINWGWGGMSDGFFRLNALDPYNQGAGGSGDGSGFNFMQDIICDIRPDFDGTSTFNLSLICNDGIEMTASRSAKTVTVSNGGYNPGPGTFATGLVGLQCEPIDQFERPTGEETLHLLDSFTDLPPRYGFRNLEYSTTGIPDGKYKVTLVYADSYDENGPEPVFKPVGHPSGSQGTYFLSIKNGKPGIYPRTLSLPTISFVEFPSSINADTPFSVKVTFADDMPAEYATSFAVCLIDDDFNLIGASQDVWVAIDEETGREVEFETSLVDYSSIEPGDYSILLTYPNSGNIFIPTYEAVQVNYKGNSSVATITDSVTTEAEWFNLQGLKVAVTSGNEMPTDLPAGIYIMSQGSITRKVTIR